MPSNPTWQDIVQEKQKQLEPLVQRAVDHVRTAMAARTPRITDAFFYGAIGIEPKHLVVWYIFATDGQKRDAKTNGFLAELDRKSREALGDSGYPVTVLDVISVSFASDEEINRAGGFRNFFA